MQRLTSVFLLGGAVLLTSYLNAPAQLRPAPPRVTPAELAQIDASVPLAADVAQETERLRARLAASPERPTARRDPFRFGASRPAPRPEARGEEPEAVEPPADGAPAIAWPTLVALLTDRGETAALSAAVAIGDAIEILKAGQSHGGFLVRQITATDVEVVHVASSTVTRLAIR